MNDFLYFLETSKTLISAADLSPLGLKHLEGAGEPLYRTANTGPGGKPGLVFSVGGKGKAPAFKPSEQTWRKGRPRHLAGEEVSIWVGFWNDGRPGPDDLKRARFIAGESVRLRDGNEWTVPIARSFARGSTLPKELVLGDDLVTWEPRELPEFMELCKAADHAFEIFTKAQANESGAVTVDMPYKECMAIAVTALAANYRVSAIELSMLRLFTDDEMAAVLKAICDIEALERMLAQKKADGQA